MSMVHGVKLPTAQTPPPGGVGPPSGQPQGSRGPQGEETDGGPELAAAFERKRERDEAAARAAAGEAAGLGLGLDLMQVKAEVQGGSGLADLLAAATATEGGPEGEEEGEGAMEGVEDVDAEGEEVDDEGLSEAVGGGQAVVGEPPAKKARLEEGRVAVGGVGYLPGQAYGSLVGREGMGLQAGAYVASGVASS